MYGEFMCILLFFSMAETGGCLQGVMARALEMGLVSLHRICVSVRRFCKSSAARHIYVGATCGFSCFVQRGSGRAPAHVGPMFVCLLLVSHRFGQCVVLRGCHSVSHGNGSGMRCIIRVSLGTLDESSRTRKGCGEFMCVLVCLSHVWTLRGCFQSGIA